jgi:hypothetical protein
LLYALSDNFRRDIFPGLAVGRNFLVCFALAGVALCAATPSTAQYALSKEMTGGTLRVDEANSKFNADPAPSRHLNSSNNACLRVSALSTAQLINPLLKDHILLLDNQCAQPITIRACYYKSTSCTVMRVDGYKRQQHNLGVSTTSDFRYSFREYLN